MQYALCFWVIKSEHFTDTAPVHPLCDATKDLTQYTKTCYIYKYKYIYIYIVC